MTGWPVIIYHYKIKTLLFKKRKNNLIQYTGRRYMTVVPLKDSICTVIFEDMQY